MDRLKNKSPYSKTKGFTLLELVIGMAIVSVIALAIAYIMSNSLSYHTHNSREFVVQTDVKNVAQFVSQRVKDSTVSFVLTADDYQGRSEGLSPGWNYIGLNDTKDQIVEFIYNHTTGQHVKHSLTQGAFAMKYAVFFSKDNETDDKLIQFDVAGYLDRNQVNSKNEYKYQIQSQVEAEKTNWVYSRETDNKQGVALAYRTDPIPKGMRICVTLVLDNSGSMAFRMDGRQPVNYPPPGMDNRSRLEILKTETKKLIDDFTLIGIVDVNLAPFGDKHTGNGMLLRVVEDKDTINMSIDSMVAVGWTNVGDGLRVGLNSVRSGQTDPEIEYRNYAIILTDGVANASYYSRRNNSYPTGDSTSGFSLETPWTVRQALAEQYALGYISRLYSTHQAMLTKAYVIGFSGVPSEKVQGNDIARRCGGQGDNYYDASNSDELRNIFEEIRNEITKEIWYVMGP